MSIQPPEVRIVGLAYMSIYVSDFEAAARFYTSVFGSPDYTEPAVQLLGWRMGSTWFTLFPASAGPAPDSDPKNTEFAIQVDSEQGVDALYARLIEMGAVSCLAPRNTRMYEAMRFGCVDDPFGVRIDIYFPLHTQESS